MVVELAIAPWAFLRFVGVILIAAGFLLILAESIKQAQRDLKSNRLKLMRVRIRRARINVSFSCARKKSRRYRST